MTTAITSGVSLQPFHVNLFFGEWENSLLLGRLSLEIRLFSGRAGGFGDHFHPSISHCIFMCIVGSENMLLPSMHVSIPLSTPVDRVHFHPSISHCIFMCIVGSENMLLWQDQAGLDQVRPAQAGLGWPKQDIFLHGSFCFSLVPDYGNQ